MQLRIYDSGKLGLAKKTIDWETDTFHLLLVSEDYAFDPNHVYISDITNELSGTGYSRKVLTGLAIELNPPAHRVEYRATNVVIGPLAVDVTKPGKYIIAKFVTDDSDSELVVCVPIVSPVPDGISRTLVFSTSGVFYI